MKEIFVSDGVKYFDQMMNSDIRRKRVEGVAQQLYKEHPDVCVLKIRHRLGSILVDVPDDRVEDLSAWLQEENARFFNFQAPVARHKKHNRSHALYPA